MLKNKTILVAGAGGLLGSRLVFSLVEQGASVIATDVDLQGMMARFEKNFQAKDWKRFLVFNWI